jgi:conjugal transfer mating pair stabilization protein TraG
MVYEIYTYGNGEVLNGVFNSIAMCMNGHTGTLFEPLKRMALILGAFWAAVSALGGDQARVLTHWIVPMAIFMNVLFVPSVSVWIHDPVTNYHQKVDNVPYGLAAFAGYTSKIGYHITEEVEKVFTLPDDLRYQKSGFLFASNILQKAKSFHITNEDLLENMRSFVGQCVLYDAMLGRKYTIEDLRNSDDIWGLISAAPSPVRSFLWKEPKTDAAPRGRPEIITCAVGVARINRLWAGELDRSANLFGVKIFGKNGLVNPKTELLKHLPLSYAQLGNIAKGASEILKQQMMIYSIVDGVESNSTALGNAPNFATRRAYLQQRTTYETLGAMAGETLPIMKAVLEAIVYAFFLFVIPLCLVPSGYRFLMVWGQSLLWLQMWAPLYAVLNYIMTMAAKSKTLAALSISNEAGVTIASSVGIANMNADISAMAGYLAMSIPFLSLALVKGVGSFVHMASHLGNVSQGVASMAAGEVTSGNLSFGNVSQGNSQIANSSMLNHSNAASFKGASAHIQDGRSEITTMADGSQVVNVGSSNLPLSLNIAESQSAQLSQMASQSTQKAMNLSESSAQNLSSTARHAVSLSETLAKLESSSDSANLGTSTEQSKAIHHGANLVKDFAKQNQIDEGKSAQLLANASIGSGKGVGLFGGSVGIGGEISAKEQELYTKAQKFAEDHHYQEAMREAASASKQLSHNLTDESSRRLAEDVYGSYEKGMSQRNEASKSFRQAADYSNQASFTKANSATINANHNQQFSEWLANQPADNTNGGTIGARGASHIIASKPQEAMAYAQRYMAEKGLAPTNPVSSGTDLKPSYDQEQAHQVYPVTKESLQDVRSLATDISNSKTQGINRHESPLETRGSVQQTAQNSNDTMEQPSRFTEEKSTNPILHGSSSGIQIKDNPASGQVQQVHPVTKGDLQSVRSQHGDLSQTHGIDSKGGQRDIRRGTDQHIDSNPNRVKAQANSVTTEQSINLSYQKVSPSLQIKGSQPSNQVLQSHDVAKNDLRSVSSQGSNLSSAKRQGAETREKVEATQSQHSQNISTESSGVLTHGADLKNNVHAEQDKGVVRRISSKGAKEAKSVLDDIKNIKFGENQQK